MTGTARNRVRVDRQVALPLAVALVLGGPLRAAPQEEASEEQPAATVYELDAELFAAVELILTPPATQKKVDPKAMSEAIVALGTPAIPVVVSVLAGEAQPAFFVQGTLEEPVHPEALAQRTSVLRAALAGFPRSAVLAHVGQRLAGEPSMDLRLMLAGMLGQVRDDRAFTLLLQVVDGVEPIHLMRSYVQATIEPALAAHLARDPRLLRELEKRAQRGSPSALAVYARAVGRTHSAAGVELLAGWVGRDPESDAIVLSQLGRVAGDGGLAISPTSLAIVRRSATSEHLTVQRAALVALGRLRDAEAFELLVGLLESRLSLAASSAHWSLVRICDVDPGTKSQPWREWREREKTWWNDQAPALLEDLHAEEPGIVLQAVAELMRHPLHRHDVAEAVGPLLGHPDEQIARGACAAISRLDSSKAVPWLLDALGKPDPELQRLAAAGLARLTGLDLPPDPLVWSKLLSS